ncbi:transcriptional regulator, partial [Salmonella enterica subsp. enterica serovar Kottbus]|nr:transcriptional regulator [Salmonella enterica subsp. enterica serovar Kottbus]
MDKRDVATLFRERLKTLLARSGHNQSAFAAS